MNLNKNLHNYILFLLVSFVFFQCIGLVLFKYKIVISPYVFDLLFVMLYLNTLIVCKFSILRLSVFIIALIYLILYIFNSFFNVDSTPIIFLTIKPFLYISMFLFVVNDSTNYREPNSKLFLSFIILYVLSLLLQYILPINIRGMRPFVFVENNFESVFLIIPVIVFYRKSLYKLIFLNSLWLSLSAIMISGFSFLSNYKSFYLKLFFFIITSALFSFVLFYLRSGELMEIDRVVFLSIFFDELSNLDFVNILFGNLQPFKIGEAYCGNLQYYNNFTFYHCSSVLLHLFWIRVILDFGLFPSFLILFFSFFLLHRNLRVIFYALILSGLSVSSIASGFIAFSFLFFIRVK